MSFWEKLSKPIIGLAPMDGVTDYPMRETFAKISKPDVLYTEFVSAEGLVRNKDKFLKVLTFSSCQRPIVAQLFGENPESFYKASKLLMEMKFDGIDINMGCPAKKVLLRNAGAALINNYDLAGKIVLAVKKAIGEYCSFVPISIKTRVVKDSELNNLWFSYLSDLPISAVCIHGRPLSQGLTGDVNWERIGISAKILKPKSIIVLGNGGISNYNDAIDYSDKYCLDGVLIGKSALGNPWIFNNIAPTKKQILNAIIDHARLAYDFYGEKGYVKVVKHLGWYSKKFAKAKDLRSKLLLTRTLSQTVEVIKDFDDKVSTNISADD